MKIYSKFKDYYDYYARNRLISDQTRIWERSCKNVSCLFAKPKTLSIFTDRKEAIGFHIYFCGEIIPVICVDDNGINFYYSADTLPVWLTKEISMRCFGVYKTAEEFFSTVKYIEKSGFGQIVPRLEAVDLHRKLNTPVFVDGNCIRDDSSVYFYRFDYSDKTVINPVLDKLQFHKKYDAFTCFQKLERFINNDLVVKDTKCDIPIPDKLKAESKGFDKFSFRREKRD